RAPPAGRPRGGTAKLARDVPRVATRVAQPGRRLRSRLTRPTLRPSMADRTPTEQKTDEDRCCHRSLHPLGMRWTEVSLSRMATSPQPAAGPSLKEDEYEQAVPRNDQRRHPRFDA